MTQIKTNSAYLNKTPAGKIKELNAKYAITINDIAEVLDVASKTVSRWTKQKGSSRLISEQKRDRLQILESILKLGKKVLGSDDELNHWLHSPVLSLNNQKPIELLKTESGRKKVEETLHQIEFGIY